MKKNTEHICEEIFDLGRIKPVMASFRAPQTSVANIEIIGAFALYLSFVGILFILVNNASFSLTCGLFLLPSYLLCGFGIAKIFAIQHDCGHNSFFPSASANRLLGRLCSLVTLVPFNAWKEEHQEHHSSFGNIDEQTYGDIWLMTVDEFRIASTPVQICYRLFRSRIFLVIVAPAIYLLVRQRLPSRLTRGRVLSVITHSSALATLYGGLFWLTGCALWYVIVPPLYIASAVGVIIFVVEHQFEDTRWETGSNWDFYNAAVHSSSYLEMPRLLEWFTGSIGYHHIHHMNPRIPSYRLRECFLALGEKLPYKKITLSSIPSQLKLVLWSNQSNKLVGFSEA